MNWYALAIRSQRYTTILEKISCLDVSTYYPMRTTWRKQRSGPRKRKQYPLMPSYLFVGCDLNQVSARSILLIDGVINFLGIKGVPSVVDIDQLETIRKCEVAGDYDETLARIEQLLVGQSMVIEEGPFQSYSGIVTSVTGDSVELDVMLFGRMNPIKINIDKLSKRI